MSGREIAAALPMALGVLGALLGAFGLARLRDPFARLHASGFAAIVGPAGVAAAMAIAGVPAGTTLRAAWIAVMILVTGPLLTHVTARAERLRRDEARERDGGADPR